MGRHKTRNKHLPPRMRLVAGRYYHVASRTDAGKTTRPCTPLGDDYVRALINYRELEGLNESADTVAAMLDRYIFSVPTTNAGTLKEYTRATTRLKQAFQGFSLDDVKPRHVARYLADHKAKVTANREIAVLSGAFNRARATGYWDGANPCTGIERNAEKARKRICTPEEMRQIVSGEGSMPVMAELALLTGLRASDIRLLRLDQVGDEMTATPRKTETRTGVSIAFEWTPALRACIARARLLRRRVGSVYVFCNAEGRPYTANGFQSLWRNHVKRLGIEGLTFNDLRRTAINMAKEQGGSDYAQQFAGHASVTTTEGYLKPLKVNRVRPTK